jgi:excisionase family DNA binding protein
MADDVLTTTEAAKLLGISVRTAQLMIEGGKLPSWKTPGGHRRVLRSDVEAILPGAAADGRVQSATVLAVTDDAGRPGFEAVLRRIAHIAPVFHTDTWLAAAAAGERIPAAVVVDVAAFQGAAVGLLEALAEFGHFKDAALIAVIPVGKRGAVKLPARVVKTSLEALGGVLIQLTADEPAPADPIERGFPVPPNEASRLQAVQRSGLVDTAPESAFDRVTWLAANELKMPVALMTLLTGDRQWFKSRQGLALPETPRSWAFCNHTVLQRDVFEVKNLSTHDSFASNPAVADAPHFRFYAGAPVYDPDGFALGSICVIDYRARQLDARQRKTLQELAAIASDAVLLRQMQGRLN